MRALLAEDDETLRRHFADTVRAAGYEVVDVGDGAAAWEAFEREAPQLVIVDRELPGLDGLELCRRVRAHDDGADAYLLVVTTRDGTTDLLSVLDAGADDYVTKPTTPQSLAARLTIAARRMAQDDARRRAEAALARARWLAGIGETSIALQHEINNPLAALLGHASLIEHGLVEPDEEREVLAVIVEQAHRIAAVVKRLSALRNPQSVEYLEGARMIDLSRTGEHPIPGAPPG